MDQQGWINLWVCLGVRTILHVERGGWKAGKEKSEDFMEEVVRLGCVTGWGTLYVISYRRWILLISILGAQ